MVLNPYIYSNKKCPKSVWDIFVSLGGENNYVFREHLGVSSEFLNALKEDKVDVSVALNDKLCEVFKMPKRTQFWINAQNKYRAFIKEHGKVPQAEIVIGLNPIYKSLSIKLRRG